MLGVEITEGVKIAYPSQVAAEAHMVVGVVVALAEGKDRWGRKCVKARVQVERRSLGPHDLAKSRPVLITNLDRALVLS